MKLCYDFASTRQDEQVRKRAILRSVYLRDIFSLAWARLNVITAIIGDVQGRLIATLFYFTILVPFGIGSRLFTDPLHRKVNPAAKSWAERHPLPTDLESAQKQG